MEIINRVSTEKIVEHIHFFRGIKIMLDHDLALLYEVQTKTIKQQYGEILIAFHLILCLN